MRALTAKEQARIEKAQVKTVAEKSMAKICELEGKMRAVQHSQIKAGGKASVVMIGGDIVAGASDSHVRKESEALMSSKRYILGGEMFLNNEEKLLVQEYQKRFASEIGQRHIDATGIMLPPLTRQGIEKVTGVDFGVKDDPLQLAANSANRLLLLPLPSSASGAGAAGNKHTSAKGDTGKGDSGHTTVANIFTKDVVKDQGSTDTKTALTKVVGVGEKLKPSDITAKPYDASVVDVKQPWMKDNKLSTKQVELLTGKSLFGHNPGNVEYKKGYLRVDTELPGGEARARIMFKKLTGQEPPTVITKDEKGVTLPDGKIISIRSASKSKSGHWKLEINDTFSQQLEKITYK